MGGTEHRGAVSGRPPERIRLAQREMAIAKATLATVEEELQLSGRKLAETIGVGPKTWRSYKNPDDPGPTPQIVYELDRVLAEQKPSKWSAGDLARQWGLETEVIEPIESISADAPSRARLLAILGVIAALAFAAIWGWWLLADDNSDQEIQQIEIFNMVVLDESQMREDTPAYLTTSPDCLSFSNCGIEGTSFVTGDVLDAVCQIKGLEVTNRFGDTANPQNYDSDLWYAIQHGTAFGYISEVWINEDDRGGIGLRQCEPSG